MTISHATLSPARLAPASFALEDDEDDSERTRIFERPVLDAVVVAPPVHHRFVFLPIAPFAHEEARVHVAHVAHVAAETVAPATSGQSTLRRVGYAMLCGSLFGIVSAASLLLWLAN